MQRKQSRRAPLTFAEAVEYLNFTDRQLRRFVAERRVPFHKMGGRLMFLVEDLDELFDSSRVEMWQPVLSFRRVVR